MACHLIKVIQTSVKTSYLRNMFYKKSLKKHCFLEKYFLPSFVVILNMHNRTKQNKILMTLTFSGF